MPLLWELAGVRLVPPRTGIIVLHKFVASTLLLGLSCALWDSWLFIPGLSPLDTRSIPPCGDPNGLQTWPLVTYRYGRGEQAALEKEVGLALQEGVPSGTKQLQEGVLHVVRVKMAQGSGNQSFPFLSCSCEGTPRSF